MKFPFYFLAVLLAGTTAAHAQKINPAQVPAAVKAAFATHFPAAKNAVWQQETQQVKQSYEYETHHDFWARDALSTQDVYEADFTLNGQKMSAIITPAGLVQETEITLASNQLPPAVRAALARDFTAYQVQEIATVTKADGSTWYEAELAQAGKKQDVLFTAEGQLAPR